MTEEEINKKAEKHCNEVLCNAHEKCNEVIKCRDWRSRRAGFFCGYEQALKDFEKENADLKEEINKIAFARGNLEEENAELKKACDETQELLDKQIEATYQLDKENAELKKKKEEIEIMTNFCKACKKMHTDQLTKAKYLISKCIKLLKLYKKTNDLETVEQLENFLKESEGK